MTACGGAVSVVGEAIGDQTPALVFLVVLYLITRYTLKTLRFFFDQVAAGKVTVPGLDAETAPITYRIIKLLIIAFVLVMAYPFIPGSDSPAFRGISIFSECFFHWVPRLPLPTSLPAFLSLTSGPFGWEM